MPMVILAIAVIGQLCLAKSEGQSSSSGQNGYVGAARCAACHAAIVEAQQRSDHARTLRPITDLSELLARLPIRFVDHENSVRYRLERSTAGTEMDLVAEKDASLERLHLLWAFGAGRKGVTFFGKTPRGEYVQSRVSWYERIQGLDVTTGGEVKKVHNAHEALGQLQAPDAREECFACHMTRNAHLLPEQMDESIAGIQCERCHGPGRKHIEFISEGKGNGGPFIQNPGKLPAKQQLHFCGVCHRQPVEEFSKVILDKATIRFPAQRLVLSRCYDEGDGKLKCTTCHDPHENLPQSMSSYDPKCQTCHAGKNALGSPCPVSQKDCVSCHMPREPLMTHSDFADHWIRKIRSRAQ